ncbi:hypothetical protein LZ31DRAFT_548774 [Colletotrichum somersetense]|nr:hypothetical protein LZ31DRAFT_548774 [Colletotrichum somersetense]
MCSWPDLPSGARLACSIGAFEEFCPGPNPPSIKHTSSWPESALPRRPSTNTYPPASHRTLCATHMPADHPNPNRGGGVEWDGGC